MWYVKKNILSLGGGAPKVHVELHGVAEIG